MSIEKDLNMFERIKFNFTNCGRMFVTGVLFGLAVVCIITVILLSTNMVHFGAYHERFADPVATGAAIGAITTGTPGGAAAGALGGAASAVIDQLVARNDMPTTGDWYSGSDNCIRYPADPRCSATGASKLISDPGYWNPGSTNCVAYPADFRCAPPPPPNKTGMIVGFSIAGGLLAILALGYGATEYNDYKDKKKREEEAKEKPVNLN